MRFTIAIQVACGALAVSARSLLTKRQAGPLSLEDFGTFETMSLEEAKASPATEDDTPFSVQDVGDTHFGTAAVCANPRVRVEWRNMTDPDRRSFLSAINCLMNAPPSGNFPPSTSRYEDLVAVHQLATANVHMSGLFLPWHRYYMWIFSGLLRGECGYTAPLPWWDETRDAGNFVNSGLFTDDYFGALPGNGGSCITNGAFAGRTLNIGPGSDNRPHCLQRNVDESQTANVNQDFVNQCNSRPSYQDMEGCMERGPHAFGHNGIGAVMAEVSASPGDPIFFLHHGFVDHTWHQWQLGDPARFTSISGCATPGENCEPLTPDTVLSSRGMRPDVTVRDMLDIREEFLCYVYDY